MKFYYIINKINKMSDDTDFSKGNGFYLDSLNLKEEDKEDFKKYREFIRDNYFYLNENSGQMDYSASSILSNIHWGQLKLFLSEFFSIIYHLAPDVKNVVYVGAANGSHIYVLAELFEHLHFYLYDSRKFDKRLYKLKNITIRKKYFDDSDIVFWKKKDKIFFISDIRTLTYDPGAQTDDMRVKNEESVWNDMKLQENWIKELRPSLSLIKFRLPFAYDFILREGNTRNYLNGEVCYQVYNKPSSSETRLLVKDIEYKDWDIIKYEKSLAYHNAIVRNKMKFFNPINGKIKEIYPEKGLFNDFDSTYFAVLVIDFIKSMKEEVTEENVKNIIDYILDNITPYEVNLNSKRAGF